MNEKQIKALVLNEMLTRGLISRGAIVANEYRIGNSGVRADLAIVDAILIGIEIKSQHDSLRRLKTQLAAYLETFDKVIVVISESHARRLDRYADLSTAEVWKIDLLGNIKRIKRGKTVINNRNNHLERLLYKRDLKFQNPPTTKELRHIVFSRFKAKFEGTSNIFWNALEGGSVTTESLDRLSAFKPARSIQKSKANERKLSFSKWSQP